MSDHRENIYDVASRRAACMRKALDAYMEDGDDAHHPLDDEHVLEVSFYRLVSDTDDSYICEFLLAVGGPTTRVTVDSRWLNVVFSHSWGKDHEGNDCFTIECFGDDAYPWIELAEGHAELMAEVGR